MSQTLLRDYFLVGYLPPIVGVYFNSLELLLTAEQGASAVLQERVDGQAYSLAQPARRDGVIANVRKTAELLTALGATPPTPPQTPTDYHSWAKQVAAEVTAAKAPESAARAAHLLGLLLGELCLALNLGVLANYLLDAEPTAAQLQEQEKKWHQSIARTHERSLRALAHLALSIENKSVVEQALQRALGNDSAATAGLPRAEAQQQALRLIAEAVRASEILFS